MRTLTDAEKRQLSPQDLLMAELAEKKILDARREEEEEYNLYNAAADALERDPDATSVKGRVIMRNRAAHKEASDKKDTIVALFMAEAGITLAGLKNLFHFGSALIAPFEVAAAKPKITTPEKDLMRTFETARVTRETQEKLDHESKLINGKLALLLAAKFSDAAPAEPQKITKMEAEISTMAAAFQMALHPQQHIYVHNIARVEALELVHNPSKDPRKCTGCVSVFRIHAHGVDSREIRVKVGDQYDQKPAEIIVSGDHLKGQDGPALRHS